MRIINLTKEHRGGARSTTFSGRLEGEAVREELKLDALDNSNENVTITIPNDTTSFNPSFFLGLLFKSVKKMGSVDAFKKRFSFDFSNYTDKELLKYVQQDIEDSYRRCINELNKKTGLD